MPSRKTRVRSGVRTVTERRAPLPAARSLLEPLRGELVQLGAQLVADGNRRLQPVCEPSVPEQPAQRIGRR